MKFSTFVSGLAAAGAASAAKIPKHKRDLPTTKIANIEVVNTPLVQNAIKLIEGFKPLQPYLYNHLMRSWLFGAAAFNNNATLKGEIDLELHAVGAMLHDLGWDMREDSQWHSTNRPFEVDSGLGAVDFVKQHCRSGWSDARLEKMYDGIVLQGMGSYLAGKNQDTLWIVKSVEFEFPGPRSPLIKDEDYDSILAAFPNDTVFRGSNETFTYLALTKPDGTRGTFIDQFGVAYVPGYGELSHVAFDLITGAIPDEIANHPNSTFVSNL
ncbi:hypothetical protein F5Y08DRAFT_320201 [Xylaria arbuscula]|uniref:HD domain-containing protein n=1 Tax=Xylaria arbuscula TaxID=114810 RepID=A0A9W8NLF5_9PEZI|nr:hypothetical protein F5Y08DRAFT_320201 [Xylaria arbuscula]KAJ3578652.1 hypothetical protein NPX13_g1915 [Xylaria arbuscula]